VLTSGLVISGLVISGLVISARFLSLPALDTAQYRAVITRVGRHTTQTAPWVVAEA
jgi:hypothetical protein